MRELRPAAAGTLGRCACGGSRSLAQVARLVEVAVRCFEGCHCTLHALTQLLAHAFAEALAAMLLARGAEVAEETGLVILTTFRVVECARLAPPSPVLHAAG